MKNKRLSLLFSNLDTINSVKLKCSKEDAHLLIKLTHESIIHIF